MKCNELYPIDITKLLLKSLKHYNFQASIFCWNFLCIIDTSVIWPGNDLKLLEHITAMHKTIIRTAHLETEATNDSKIHWLWDYTLHTLSLSFFFLVKLSFWPFFLFSFLGLINIILKVMWLRGQYEWRQHGSFVILSSNMI